MKLTYTDNILIALGQFKKDLDKKFTDQGDFPHIFDTVNEVYDNITEFYINTDPNKQDVYSNLDQLDMFDENVHVKDV